MQNKLGRKPNTPYHPLQLLAAALSVAAGEPVSAAAKRLGVPHSAVRAVAGRLA